MDALHGDFAEGVALNNVFHEVPTGATQQNPTGLALGLDTRGDVHLKPDGCVGGAAIRTESADAEHPGVDPDPHSKRLFDA